MANFIGTPVKGTGITKKKQKKNKKQRRKMILITISFMVGFIAGWIINNYYDTINSYIKGLF